MSLVKHSDIFSARFQKNCKLLETNPTSCTGIRDIASSKHRYDSHQKPFGRGCIYWPALVITAQQILDERGTAHSAGDRALQFLTHIDAEVMLCFAMMADAGDECLILVRFLESESFDKSMLAPELDTFMHRIKILFNEKQCLSTGYTKHMLSILKNPITVFLKDSQPKVLGCKGGPTTDLAQRCLQRLSNWCNLALATLRSEFPNFEILQTFNIFRLGGKPRHQLTADDELNAMSVQRSKYAKALAGCLKLDADALEAQLLYHIELARKLQVAKNMSAIEAWADAVQITKQSKAAGGCDASTVLVKALARFAAWGGSTGGVERLFSEGKNIGGVSQRNWNFSLYSDELQICCDKDSVVVAQVCMGARSVWAKLYGAPRTHRRMRIDSGRSKQPSKLRLKPSLAGWIRNRREDVTKLEGKYPRVALRDEVLPAVSIGVDGWTESHHRELTFQRRKRAQRFIEAVQEGGQIHWATSPRILLLLIPLT